MGNYIAYLGGTEGAPLLKMLGAVLRILQAVLGIFEVVCSILGLY